MSLRCRFFSHHFRLTILRFTHMIDCLIFITRGTFADDVCSFFFFIVVCTEMRGICVFDAFILSPYTEAKHTIRAVQILIYWKYCIGIRVRVCVSVCSVCGLFLSQLRFHFYSILFDILLLFSYIIGVYFIASVRFRLNFSVTSICVI